MSLEYKSSFSSGELSPAFHARNDLPQYAAGLGTELNFISSAQGGMFNRPGFKHITPATAAGARVITFDESIAQSHFIEFTNGFFRVFDVNGAVVQAATVSPYTTDLDSIKFDVNRNVMFFAHPTVQTHKLTRVGTTFTMEIQDLDVPVIPFNITSKTAVWTGTTVTPLTMYYNISVLLSDGTETRIDTEFSVEVEADWLEADYVTITMDADLPDALGATILIYKSVANDTSFGLIGTAQYVNASTTLLIDHNIEPDQSFSRRSGFPVNRIADEDGFLSNGFTDPDGYPSVTAVYQQRSIYAHTINEPDTVFTSNLGRYEDFSVGRDATRATDAMSARAGSTANDEILNMVTQDKLLLFTSGAEFTFGPPPGHPLTPSNPPPEFRVQSHYGSTPDPEPLPVDKSVLFIQRDRKTIRDLMSNFDTLGYQGNDITILSDHIFNGKAIVDWTYQRAPNKNIWCILDDGTAAVMTYEREHGVFAWSRHTTDGLFKSITSLPGTNYDPVFAVIERNGIEYIEQLTERLDDAVNGVFLDASVTYNGVETGTISGLDHLNGQTITAVVDGMVHPDLLVTAGSITLTDDQTGSVWNAGLSYVSDADTLDMALMGKRQKVGEVILQVYKTRGLKAGPDFNNMSDITTRQFEDYNDPTVLFTGFNRKTVTPKWKRGVKVAIRQTFPLPCTILGIMTDVKQGN